MSDAAAATARLYVEMVEKRPVQCDEVIPSEFIEIALANLRKYGIAGLMAGGAAAAGKTGFSGPFRHSRWSSHGIIGQGQHRW
jgi:hypothetical protein